MIQVRTIIRLVLTIKPQHKERTRFVNGFGIFIRSLKTSSKTFQQTLTASRNMFGLRVGLTSAPLRTPWLQILCLSFFSLWKTKISVNRHDIEFSELPCRPTQPSVFPDKENKKYTPLPRRKCTISWSIGGHVYINSVNWAGLVTILQSIWPGYNAKDLKLLN